MKKLILVAMAILLCVGFAWADDKIFVKTQPTESTTYTIVYSGTSTFPVIDLGNVQDNNGKNMGPVTGDITFELNTWTKPTGSTSGVTTNWYVRYSSQNNTSAWAQAQQIPIITGLAHSGTTGYQWSLDPDLSKFMRVECVSGASNATVSFDLTFQKDSGNWHKPLPNKISDEDVAVTSGATPTLTRPSGANMAWIYIQGDAIRWKADSSDPSGANGALLYEGDAKKLLCAKEIDDFAAVLNTGGSGATIHVIYYRE